MKKLICIISTAVLLLTSVLFGGNGDIEAKTQAADGTVTTVCGYETQADLNTLMPYMYFGKVELEDDAKYVKEGKCSAKFTIQSDKFDGAFSNMVFIFQSLKNVSKGIDKTDAKSVKKIEFDVYNTSSETVRIGVRLVYYRRYYGDKRSDIKYVQLAANCWTTVSYTVDYNRVPLTLAEGGAEKYIIGVDYMFNIPSNGKTDAIYYIDNFRISE